MLRAFSWERLTSRGNPRKACRGGALRHRALDFLAADGRMEERAMGGDDVVVGEEGRWFADGVDVDSVQLGETDF